MKLEDAPAPGWYPDPENDDSLRWWIGDDWSDKRRAPPSTTERAYELRAITERVKEPAPQYVVPVDPRLSRRDADEIVNQVRTVAREEVQRAADLFSDRSTTAVRALQRVVSGYASTFFRWLRIALFVAAVLVIAWFFLQLFVQTSLLNWFGDRIDSLTGN